MNTITYTNINSSGAMVYLDKQKVGMIKKVEGGWQYFPKGQEDGGEIFNSFSLCQQSLKED